MSGCAGEVKWKAMQHPWHNEDVHSEWKAEWDQLRQISSVAITTFFN